MRLVLLVAALCLATGPTVALDAIAYKGTLGGSAIVLEMTDPAAGDVVGRYSYMRVGGDIPLRHGRRYRPPSASAWPGRGR